MADLEVTSSAFAEGERIPERHTCEGENVSPPLSWSGVPEGTISLALIVHDPDAPAGDFVHWLGWGIRADAGGLGEGEGAPAEGTNGFGQPGYGGPCPPPGSSHRYFHRLYALDRELDVDDGASREELERAMEGGVLAEGQLMGTFER
jgi:Raf kinase inhibitor-like YbhB/YbcL family protein